MHSDTRNANAHLDWAPYLDEPSSLGELRGGSAIGLGVCINSTAPSPEISKHIVGYIKVEIRAFDHATKLIANNPIYEAGSTVEIRELLETS